MKIVLFANFKHPAGHEDAIAYALEQEGHEVIRIPEDNFKEEDILNSGADLLWFFKGAINYGYPVDKFLMLLEKFPGKKVCWVFDKIYPGYSHTEGREIWAEAILQRVDLMETEDGEYVNSRRFINLDHLKRGADERVVKRGIYKPEYDCDVAFVGTLYGKRAQWWELVKLRYGKKAKMFQGVYGDELNNLCASAKVIVSPDYPFNDWYWSQRIYDIIARGGFMVHPRLLGLKKDFTEGKHFVAYRKYTEMIDKIDFYLTRPKLRERITEAGMKHILENHTYRHAVRNTLKKLRYD